MASAGGEEEFGDEDEGRKGGKKKENFIKAIEELRKFEKDSENKRKFTQTVDLIVNLRAFDIKKNSINTVVNLPHSLGKKKVAAF